MTARIKECNANNTKQNYVTLHHIALHYITCRIALHHIMYIALHYITCRIVLCHVL